MQNVGRRQKLGPVIKPKYTWTKNIRTGLVWTTKLMRNSEPQTGDVKIGLLSFFLSFFFILEFPPLSFIYRFFIICGLTLQTWSFCWFCLLPLYNCRWVYMEREKDRYKLWILFLLLIVDPTVLTLLHYFGLCYIVCTTCFTYPYENVFGFITSWTSDHRMP